MAYDKVVDSASLDAGLSSVANAIRKKSGTENGLTFPDGFVSAIEQIAVGGGAVSGEVRDVSLLRDVNNERMPIVIGSEFVAENYTKEGFVAVLFKAEPPSASSETMLSIVQGNLNLGSSNVPHYGYYAYASGTMAVSTAKITTEMKKETNGNTLYVNSGAVFVQTSLSITLPAGNYKMVLLCFDV